MGKLTKVSKTRTLNQVIDLLRNKNPTINTLYSTCKKQNFNPYGPEAMREYLIALFVENENLKVAANYMRDQLNQRSN